MPRYALVTDGVVREVLSVESGVKLGVDMFTPEQAAHLHPCTPDVELGWTFDGRAYARPVADPPSATALSAYARQVSKAMRALGAEVAGTTIATDSESLTLISGMVALAEADASRVFEFDRGDETITLSAKQAIALGHGVAAAVQDGFTLRAKVLKDIASGRLTTFSAVEAALSA